VIDGPPTVRPGLLVTPPTIALPIKNGHRVLFSNVVAGAAAAFFTMLPQRVSARPGWMKPMVFRHN
jgi:acyl-CoA hydrolase